MNSRHLSTVTAALLLGSGLLLLFASDAILPALESSAGAESFWIGQQLAAALLALGFLDYMNRSAILGGIYGRPVVMANAVFFFVGGISILQITLAKGLPPALTMITVVMLIFASIYWLLLFKGPFGSDSPTGSVKQAST